MSIKCAFVGSLYKIIKMNGTGIKIMCWLSCPILRVYMFRTSVCLTDKTWYVDASYLWYFRIHLLHITLLAPITLWWVPDFLRVYFRTYTVLSRVQWFIPGSSGMWYNIVWFMPFFCFWKILIQNTRMCQSITQQFISYTLNSI